MNADAAYVGIGVWGNGGNIVNAMPQIHTQDFATIAGGNFYPDVRIYSGSHIFIGTGVGDNMQTFEFWANYFDAAPPTSAQVWFDGQLLPLTCKPGWGPNAGNCIYSSALQTTGTGCRLYYFQFMDSAGAAKRYPEEGAYWTYGEGNCLQDWIPAAQADPLIAGATTSLPTTTMPGQTFSTGPPTPPTQGTTVPLPVTSILPTVPPGGTPASPLYQGATGCRIQIRYFTNFFEYVSNGAFVSATVNALVASQAELFNVPVNRLAIEVIAEGSIIVDWFLVDEGTPGSGADIADAFLARLGTGADLAIGQHQPPLLDVTITARNGVLGSPSSGTAIGLLIGIVVGGILFLALIALVLLVIFRHRKGLSVWPSFLTRSRRGASQSGPRYEPVVSNFYGNEQEREPLMSNEPLLYMTRKSRPSANRQNAVAMSNLNSASEFPRAIVMYDFEGHTAPNCLTCVKGEIVMVEDQSSDEWWDCRNANGELGFVPQKFLQIIKQAAVSPRSQTGMPMVNKPVPKPPGGKKKTAAAILPTEERMIIIEDFDGTGIPNALTVFQGEEVVIESRTNAEWWDVRNVRDEIGFVPSSFLREIRSADMIVGRQHAPVLQELDHDFGNNEDENLVTIQAFDMLGDDDDDNDVTMETPLIQNTVRMKSRPSVTPAKKAFIPGKTAAPLPAKVAKAAPIPGTPFIVQFAYEPVGDTEIQCAAGDEVIAPIGADLKSEWLYAKNRTTGKEGFIPMTWVKRK